MTDRTAWGRMALHIQNPAGERHLIVVYGRERWALECLMAAREKGCTPIHNPAPRWSAYVFELRGMGVAIETIRELHAGPFERTHARYVLRAQVNRADAVTP